MSDTRRRDLAYNLKKMRATPFVDVIPSKRYTGKKAAVWYSNKLRMSGQYPKKKK